MHQCFTIFYDYILDLVFVALSQVTWLCLKYLGKSYDRGFFCSDQSLMYPWKENTVTNAVLTAINLTFPILTIFIVELKISGVWKSSQSPEAKNMYFRLIFKTLCIFFIGVGVNESATNILKFSIGRLRPHFMEVCVPSYKSPCNPNLYITGFECFGTNQKRIRDSRLSFPSGHASSSMYCLLFTALYVHFRARRCKMPAFKVLYEGALITLSLWIGITRVSDFKHHWSDVLAGFALGAVFGILFASAAIRNFNPLRDIWCDAGFNSNIKEWYRKKEGYEKSQFGQTTSYGYGNSSQPAPLNDRYHVTTSVSPMIIDSEYVKRNHTPV